MERWCLLRASRTLCAAGLLSIAAGFSPAEAAPQQLLNKTVTISYTTNGTYRDSNGKISSSTGAWSFAEYISSAGRIFERFTPQGHNSNDFEPNRPRNANGEVRSTRFEGNKLVHVAAYASGAFRFVVSFDPSFSSCTVDIVFARDGGGAIKRKGQDGKLFEFVSQSVSGNSCSIRDGNSFAN